MTPPLVRISRNLSVLVVRKNQGISKPPPPSARTSYVHVHGPSGKSQAKGCIRIKQEMPFTQPKFELYSLIVLVVVVLVERVFLAQRPESQAALADRLAGPVGPPVNKQLKVNK